MTHRILFYTNGLILALLLLFNLSSCTEDITLNTDNATPVIVIYGTITDEPIYQEVHISASTGYFETTKNPKISGAVVTITTGSGDVYTLKEASSTPGTYRTETPLAGKLGETYHLKVVVDFNNDGVPDTYEATTAMKKDKIEMDSITVTHEQITNRSFYSFNIYAQELPDKNYYMCHYQVNDTLYSQISKYIIFDDKVFDNQYIKGTSIGYFPDNIDRSKYDDKDDYDSMVFISEGDRVKITISNIDKKYYDFLHQCQNERDGENPFFGGPLSNISTNITGGGIGFFTAYSVSEAKSIAGKAKKN